uniref:Uncharacterized protein n=1 Tax=Arundo donax TaxID=35708 RepID=A0A0A9C424_ARUDO
MHSCRIFLKLLVDLIQNQKSLYVHTLQVLSSNVSMAKNHAEFFLNFELI